MAVSTSLEHGASRIKERPFDPNADDARAELRRRGEIAFQKSWDSGEPGQGEGLETLYRLAEAFWYVPDDDCIQGPFTSLDAALDECDDLVAVTEATIDIDCSLLSAREITLRLRDDTIDGTALDLEINGALWRLENGQWREQEES